MHKYHIPFCLYLFVNIVVLCTSPCCAFRICIMRGFRLWSPHFSKPMEGPCRLLKKHTLGAMLPKRCIQEGNNFSGSRIFKLHLCHMHFFMHSSIPPMRYRSFDLHQLLSHFSKHGNKSNRQEVLPSQGQKPRYHQHQGIRTVDGTPPNASLPQDLRKRS